MHRYKWQDVPGYYLLFDDNTALQYFLTFWGLGTESGAIATRMIERMAAKTAFFGQRRNLFYAASQLAIQVEDRCARTPVRSGTKRVSSMYAFALIDMATHFGLSDERFESLYRLNTLEREPKAFKEYVARRKAVEAFVKEKTAAKPDFYAAALAVRDYFTQPATILATGS